MSYSAELDIINVTDPAQFKALAGGEVWFGVPDGSPATVPGDRIQIYLARQGLADLAIAQPLDIGPGGQVMYSGTPAQIKVLVPYCVQVMNSLGVQKYYAPKSNGYIEKFIEIDAALDYLDSAVITVEKYSDISAALLGMSIGDQISLRGHTVAGKGGGIFNVVSSTGLTANNGTCVILGAIAAVREASEINVYDFGAIGDGVADDTNAIQAAINYITNTTFATTWSGGSRIYSKGGGRLKFLKGKFRITKGLLVGQHIEIDGGSTTGFFHPDSGGDNTGALIIADFVNPNDWIISSANYTSAGATVGYRQSIAGAQIDAGTYNSCHGITIRNLYALAVAPCYGGMRLHGSPNAVIDNVGFLLTDCGFLITSSWGGSYTNLFSLTYLYGFVGAADINAADISGYFDCIAGKNVNAGNRLEFLFPDDFNAVVGLPDFSNKKTGILLYYANSAVITKAASEHFEVSTLFSQTKALSIGTLYSELNTDSLMAAATTYGSVDAIFQQNFIAGANYHFGVGALITLSDVPALEMSIPLPAFADIKVSAANPDLRGWKYNASLTFLGYKEGVIRVSSSGVTTNVANSTTYTTLEEALNRIAASKHNDWTVIIKDGETVTNDSKKTIQNKTIRFVREGAGANPTISFTTAAGFIRSILFCGDCSVYFDNVNISFPAVAAADPLEAGGISFPQAYPSHLKAEFRNSSISLQSNWYIFQQSFGSSANVNTSFSGCAITGSGTSKIMGGQSVGNARTVVINSQQATTCSASVIAAGTNGWENSVVLTSNFV